jgi:hypothetical protein
MTVSYKKIPNVTNAKSVHEITLSRYCLRALNMSKTIERADDSEIRFLSGKRFVEVDDLKVAVQKWLTSQPARAR